MKILAIETSCDETAAAVISSHLIANNLQLKILSNVVASQIKIHQKFGGVFPEHASRAHTEKIIYVVANSLQQTANSRPHTADRSQQDTKKPSAVSRELLADIDLIAVTTGPGLIGSLLIGVNAAKTLAYTNHLPIIGINHWLGHMYSCFATEEVINSNSIVINRHSLSDKKSRGVAANHYQPLNHLPSFPALFLIVSGGHTGLVLMKSHREIIPLGETLDDAAGEAFDKVAKLLGLEYPGGPSIAKAAKIRIKNQELSIKLPRPMMYSKDYNFSFSGLKTAVLNEIRKLDKLSSQDKTMVAKEFQQAVIDVLVGKTIQAAYEYKPKSICLCGGVSANHELRDQMEKAVEKLPWRASYHIPPMIFTTDNAAMIGIAAAYQDPKKYTTYDRIEADSNLKL